MPFGALRGPKDAGLPATAAAVALDRPAAMRLQRLPAWGFAAVAAAAVVGAWPCVSLPAFGAACCCRGCIMGEGAEEARPGSC